VIRDRVSIAPNGVLVYSVQAYVRRFALGTIRNVADVRPPEGVTDPNDANNLAVDTTIIERR
jgi:hypothetical protein